MSRQITLLNKLYPYNNLPTTIYQRLDIENLEYSEQVAKKIIESLDETSLSKLITSGKDWGLFMHKNN